VGSPLGKRGGEGIALPGMPVRVYVPGEGGGVTFSNTHSSIKSVARRCKYPKSKAHLLLLCMTSEANRLRYSHRFERHGNYVVWSMEKSKSTAQHAYGQPKQARI
jgi:hypothetical protein